MLRAKTSASAWVMTPTSPLLQSSGGWITIRQSSPSYQQCTGISAAPVLIASFAEPAGILNVHDAIHRDADGRIQFHYTLIAVRGIWRSGEGVAADDAASVAWVSRAEIVAGLYPTFPTLLPLFDLALGRM